MQITHLGHAAVLVETANQRVLIDPGNFSDQWHGLDELDAILVTHQHPDHIDPEHFPALVRANPRAKVWVEPQVFDAVDLGDLDDLEATVQPLAADSSIDLGSLQVSAVGGLHAVIHRDLPTIGNVGLVLVAEGEPTFFHPGDSLATCPAGVDVLGIPAYGPWAAMKETVDFVREVGAPRGFPIHDGLLNERGWSLVFNRVGAMSQTEMLDLRGGPVTF